MTEREQEQAVLDALRHPLRQSLLQRLLQSGDRLGAGELAQAEEQPVSSVSYHLRQLADLGAIEPAGDLQIGSSFSQFYRPTPWVSESADVLSALGLEG